MAKGLARNLPGLRQGFPNQRQPLDRSREGFAASEGSRLRDGDSVDDHCHRGDRLDRNSTDRESEWLCDCRDHFPASRLDCVGGQLSSDLKAGDLHLWLADGIRHGFETGGGHPRGTLTSVRSDYFHEADQQVRGAIHQGAAESVRRAHGKPIKSAFARSIGTTWSLANGIRPSLCPKTSPRLHGGF